jgi:hypothetical protein
MGTRAIPRSRVASVGACQCFETILYASLGERGQPTEAVGDPIEVANRKPFGKPKPNLKQTLAWEPTW